MIFDEFNTGGCNGCKYHGKSDEDYWRYADGSPRNDTCCHPVNRSKDYDFPVPVFNVGCKNYCPEGSA